MALSKNLLRMTSAIVPTLLPAGCSLLTIMSPEPRATMRA
jgi:hypothetical protein